MVVQDHRPIDDDLKGQLQQMSASELARLGFLAEGGQIVRYGRNITRQVREHPGGVRRSTANLQRKAKRKAQAAARRTNR